MDSSVIEMSGMEDVSDYETDLTADNHGTPQEKQQADFASDIQKEMQKNVTSMILESGKQQAKKAFNLYANIDILRPYFDVEPREVRDRLIHSMIPANPKSAQKTTLHHELYGPVMLVFTLIALLLYQMKSAQHVVQEGTLMGSAFAVCFGYWLGASSLVWFLGYVCNTRASMTQLLSLIGYGLFSQCLVILFTTLFHSTHDHLYFYLMWGIIGGISAFKMVQVLTSRTIGQTQKMIMGGVIIALHMLFLLYLHFAYHQIVEDISDLLEPQADKIVPLAREHNGVQKDINDRALAEVPANLAQLPKMDGKPAFEKPATLNKRETRIESNIVNNGDNRINEEKKSKESSEKMENEHQIVEEKEGKPHPPEESKLHPKDDDDSKPRLQGKKYQQRQEVLQKLAEEAKDGDKNEKMVDSPVKRVNGN